VETGANIASDPRSGSKLFIAIGAGGILGISERKVTIPTQRVAMKGDRLVIQGMAAGQIKAIPPINANNRSFRQLEANQLVQISPMR
jgi:hypothetical protein